MSEERYSEKPVQVPAASSVNMTATCSPNGTVLTQPSSASVLTAVRGKVRRIAEESVEKQRLELLAGQIKSGVPADFVARQLEIMGG
jgi:hypothetical protein